MSNPRARAPLPCDPQVSVLNLVSTTAAANTVKQETSGDFTGTPTFNLLRATLHDGTVMITGNARGVMAQAIATGTTIFTLPPGWRPTAAYSTTAVIADVAVAVVARVDVATSGVCTLHHGITVASGDILSFNLDFVAGA